MSKYLSSKNPIDLDKVEELYKASFTKAEEKAKKKADFLLSEIRRYKSMDIEEIKAEIAKEYEETYLESIERAKKNPDSMVFHGVLAMRRELTKEQKKRDDLDDVFSSMPEEDRFALYCAGLKQTLDTNCKDEQDKALRTDILFDLLTEEQIDELVKLYYISELKYELENAKAEAIMDARDDLDKSSHIFVPNDNKIEIVEQSARKISSVEPTKREQILHRENIKGKISEGFAAMFSGGIIGSFAGVASYFIGEISGKFDGNKGFLLIPIGMATVLACFGVSNIKEFLSNKKAIDEAKKFGLYESIIQAVESRDDYDQYVGLLKEQYNVEAKAGGAR